VDHGGSSAAIRSDVGASDGFEGRVAAAEEGVSAEVECDLAAEEGQGWPGAERAEASRRGAPPVEPSPDDIVHDSRSERCPECGGSLEETGEYIEHTVEDT